MKTYFEAVIDLVGIENVCNGPSIGPVSKIKFINEFNNIPTEEEIQAKLEELQAAEPMRLLRQERDRLIQQTDWWVLPDRTATPAQLAYRQALRDLPANSTPALDENGNLTGVEWPVYSEEA